MRVKHINEDISRKYKGRTDWKQMLMEDKRSIFATMLTNLASDLQAGYSPTGNSVKKQLDEINGYRYKIEELEKKLNSMSDNEANVFAYKELVASGAIEPID